MPLGDSVPRSRASSLWAERFEEAANRDVREVSARRFNIWAQDTAEQQRASRFAPVVQPPSQEPTFFDQLGQKISDVPVLGGLLGAQGSALQWGMEQLGKPGAMVSGAILGLMSNSGGDAEEDFDVWEGIRRAWVGTEEERQDLNFATVLERGGVLAGEEHTWARNALGLIADIVIDPLNLLVIPGVASRVGKVGQLAQRAASPVTRPITRLTGGRENRLLRGLEDALSTRVGKQHRYATPKSQLDELERAGKIDPGQADQIQRIALLTKHLDAAAYNPSSIGGRRAMQKAQEEFMKDLPGFTVTRGVGPFRKTEGIGPAHWLNPLKKTEYAYGKMSMDDKVELMSTLERGRGDPYAFSDPLLKGSELEKAGKPAYFRMLNLFREQVGGREILFEEGLLPGGGYKPLPIGVRGTPVTKTILRKDLERYGKESGFSSELIRELGSGGKGISWLMKRKRPLDPIRVPVLTEGPVGKGTAAMEAALGLQSAHGMYVHRFLSIAELADDVTPGGSRGMTSQMDAGERFFTPKLLERTTPARGPDDFRRLISEGDPSADPLLVYAADLTHSTAKIQWADFLVHPKKGVLRPQNGVVEVPAAIASALNKARKGSPEYNEAYGVYNGWLKKQISTEGSPLYGRNVGQEYTQYNTTLPSFKAGDELSSLPKVVEKHFGENRMFVGPKEVINVLESWSEPYVQHGLFRHAEAVQSLWKPLVTVLFPAYHIRNVMGLVHNNLMARVGLGSWYKAAKLMKGGYTNETFNVAEQGVKRWATTDEFVKELEEANIVGAGTRYLSPADVEAMLRFDPQDPGKGRNILQRVTDAMQGRGELEGVVGEKTASLETWKALLHADMDGRWAEAPAWQRAFQSVNPIRMGASASEGIDNWGRIAHVIGRLDQGDSFDDAVRSAKRYIFAYNEAPPSVQSLATVMPFFRWTYFNVPLQAKEMLLRPYGAVRMTGYLTRSFEGIQGDQLTGAEALDAEAASLPDWVLERHHVQLGRNDDGTLNILYGLGLPVEDLNKLFALTPLNTLQNLITDVGPLFRVPLELATNTSVFADEPIEPGDDLFPFYSKAGKILENLPTPIGDSLRAFLEFDRRADPRTGKERLYANPTRMYVLGSIFGRIGMTVDKGWEAVEERKWNNAFHLLSGVKYREGLHADFGHHEPWQRNIREDPEMYDLYTQYKNIPLYWGLTAQQGNLAQTGLIKLGKRKNMIMDEPDFRWREREAFNRAAQELEEIDPEAVHWALEVRRRGLKASTRERERFKDANPNFAAIMRGEPIDEE
jgi:hypothetical protein